ncbi:MAG: hypothetical protein AUK35_08490 [Zetaproteobacteria bacterium CG2_30_46_52]|nr:MAG: hypothetical protein AUK35_08490 [Zetaproteobacteria bacterium CG2_30_46_52]
MTDSQQTSRLYWAPLELGLLTADGSLTLSPTVTEHDEEASSPLPQIIHDENKLDCIYLPLEHLLVRKFALPLSNLRHLDADIIGQELADNAGITPESWWLSWQAQKTEKGLSGLVFALPKNIKEAIQSDSQWQQAPLLLVDGWQRLDTYKPEQGESSLVIIDVDSEGLFFAYFKDQVCQGIRRLNANMPDDAQAGPLAKQILWSLQAMGKTTDDSALWAGRVNNSLANALVESAPETNTNTLDVSDDLPTRIEATLRLTPPTLNKQTLNLRHGKWSAKQSTQVMLHWKRPLILASLLLLVWLGSTVASNFRLESKLADMETQMTEAFHLGLPNQPVMIDVLAQLRQAANGSSGSGNSSQVTVQLAAIHSVFEKNAWQIEELKFDDKGSTMSGKISTLERLNAIRDALAAATNSEVVIADTDLSGKEVSFRLRW